jgi:hypothetical protein
MWQYSIEYISNTLRSGPRQDPAGVARPASFTKRTLLTGPDRRSRRRSSSRARLEPAPSSLLDRDDPFAQKAA